MTKYVIPVARGVLIAIFLEAIGLSIREIDWWVAVVSLNVLVNLPSPSPNA